MEKKKVCLSLGVALAATVMVMKTSSQTDKTNSLLKENIEALAEGENIWHNPSCYGDGNLDCPNGAKVAYPI